MTKKDFSVRSIILFIDIEISCLGGWIEYKPYFSAMFRIDTEETVQKCADEKKATALRQLL
jgi:hypothetical protein